MPLYEYRCDRCGEFDAWRTIAELDASMHCPLCERVAKRIFSPPNINLNVGSFQARKGEPKEPKLVTRAREPDRPRYQSQAGGRPWAISHTPPAF
jgi:putative FmdB family regulatory protein